MNKHTISLDDVNPKELPGRTVRVLTENLSAENMTIGVCDVPPRGSLFLHAHVQEELIFILKGKGFVTIDGFKEPIEPGTLVHFPSNSEHVTSNESDELMQFVFCFSPQVIVGSYDKQSSK